MTRDELTKGLNRELNSLDDSADAVTAARRVAYILFDTLSPQPAVDGEDKVASLESLIGEIDQPLWRKAALAQLDALKARAEIAEALLSKNEVRVAKIVDEQLSLKLEFAEKRLGIAVSTLTELRDGAEYTTRVVAQRALKKIEKAGAEASLNPATSGAATSSAPAVSETGTVEGAGHQRNPAADPVPALPSAVLSPDVVEARKCTEHDLRMGWNPEASLTAEREYSDAALLEAQKKLDAIERAHDMFRTHNETLQMNARGYAKRIDLNMQEIARLTGMLSAIEQHAKDWATFQHKNMDRCARDVNETIHPETRTQRRGD